MAGFSLRLVTKGNWDVLRHTVSEPENARIVHLYPADAAGLPDWAARAYEWCERLVFEQSPGAVVPYLTATDQITLSEKLRPEAYQQLLHLWQQHQIPLPLDNLHPWAARLAAAVNLQQSVPGIEPLFLEWAARDRKPVVFQ